ncbi:Met-10+ like-protein-domain-containing protein [Myxozyma melibiosi]|uniref:tRNA (guanine(37)-N1)-methyltransferase n=1 Tax=Myxozyma melibiosi TaxID=54550 RepID=A0ABR1F2I6_9ASCO
MTYHAHAISRDNAHFTPPVNRSMLVLDRDFFTVRVPLTALQILDPREFKAVRSLEQDLLQLHGVGNIVKRRREDGDGGTDFLILLRPGLGPGQMEGVSEKMKEYLEQHPDYPLVPYTLELGYKHWKPEEILSAVLPEDLLDEVPTGFSLTGHIAHMNLRSQYLPYKYLIGQVILDKNPSVRTVVNKLDTIDTVFRTFEMEVIAGEKNYMVEHRESDCTFRFDFSKVYWNSRLQGEHLRLISIFKPGEAICDVMAGVGPFALPAGKNGLMVLANDLNGDSFASMQENIKINKVSNNVFPYNLDGREFIKISVSELRRLAHLRKMLRVPVKDAASGPEGSGGEQGPSNKKAKKAENSVRRSDMQTSPDGGKEKGKKSKGRQGPKVREVPVPTTYAHYVMNLPHAAIEFLDAFRGLHKDDDVATTPMPMVHVYCFHKSDDPEDPKPEDSVVHPALRQRVADALGFEIPIEELSFHYVRLVAPSKTMHCISFRLPREVAFARD